MSDVLGNAGPVCVSLCPDSLAQPEYSMIGSTPLAFLLVHTYM